ncbi:MAG TPA: nitrite/sulfite reductase [Nitrososphaeraceae archaeon]
MLKKNEELTKINHEQGSFVKPKENWGLEKETNNFANKVKLYRQGKLADDDFRRFRLQHGAYGSRLRPDYSMIRIKVPSGEITPEQLEKIATLSEAFSIGSAHVSTRQNIQLHWVQLEDVSEVMRGLVEVGLTTREACGNTVRNVMCSHFAGVCSNEVFDATPYSTAIAKFLLRNPMSQNLPRKFKINFGCCNKHGLVRIADIGLVPDLRDGKKGFRIYLGGGLGAASFIGHLLEDFTSEEQLLSTCMATIRLFDRLGNRDNMARNRMRYLVNEIGWEKFQKMVLKERAIVEMTVSEFTKNLYQVNFDDSYVPLKKSTKFNNLPIVETNISTTSNGYDRWLHTNVVPQKQENYFTIFITLGAGDITSSQLRSLALLIRKFSSESIARNTPQQNFAIRYIYNNDLPAVYKKLMAIGLANPGALTITSAVGCSGTTSCNLAITNSHRLAKEVQRTLLELGFDVDNDLRNSTIKISGCPNSCGQHEIATIGFFGGAARIENSMAPVYTMLFGGNGYEDEGKLGKAIMRVPAKRVIDVIKKIVELYKNEKSSSETLDMWIDRIINNNGNGNIKNMDDIKTLLTPVTQLPPFEEDQELYQDYGNDIKFVAKTARGECAA